MQKVKILKAFDVYQEGEIVSFDENSAAVYVDRKVAATVDDDETSDVPRAAKPGHIVATQLVEADPGPGVVDPPSLDESKADLVARAVKQDIPEATAKNLTKPELIAKLAPTSSPAE